MKLQYEVSGRGRPLVLVPGGLTGWQSWEPHAEHLANDRMVIRVQLLSVQLGLEGHPLPDDYTIHTERSALTETLDELGLVESVDVAAWSMGGVVALDFALDNPGRIRTLTLIEPPAFWVLPQLDEETERLLQLLRGMTGEISEEQLAEFSRVVGMLSPDQAPQDSPQWPNWARHRQSLRNCPAVTEHSDDPNRLGSFRLPVLLVKGTGSAPILHQIIDELGNRLSLAQLSEWPAGHAPHIVSMDRFLERMKEFQLEPVAVD